MKEIREEKRREDSDSAIVESTLMSEKSEGKESGRRGCLVNEGEAVRHLTVLEWFNWLCCSDISIF